MAINQVTASISFDYKGQNFLLKNQINIDNIISHDDFFNSVYVFIAQENNIDLYSYQFEIMIDQNIVFSNEKGCATGCVINGDLDINMLRDKYQISEYLSKIDSIIRKNIPQEKRSKEVKKAMIEAYLLGKKSR